MIEKEYCIPSARKMLIAQIRRSLGKKGIVEEGNFAYLPRAVSTVPESMREFLNSQYSALKEIVKRSGIEPLIPVELSPETPKEMINPLNHDAIYRSRFVMPLAYAVSDGRGWEMGHSYGVKAIIPLIFKSQKINRPTIILPFQIPVIFENLENPAEGKKLENMLRLMNRYEIGTGRCSVHGDTLLGYCKESKECMRCMAGQFFDIVPSNF